MSEITKRFPAVALRGMTILPAMIVHFDISRKQSIKAVEQAMLNDQKIFVVTQRDANISEPETKDLYQVGTVAVIKQVVKLPKNVLRVLVEGSERAQLLDADMQNGYLEAKVFFIKDTSMEEVGVYGKEAMLRNLKEIFEHYAKANNKLSKDIMSQLMEMEEVDKLVDQIIVHIPLYYEEKQGLLESFELYERYEKLCVILSDEIEIINIKTELQQKVKERVDKNQREYILREQLKLIREELGEDTTFTDADNFKEAVTSLRASKDVKEKIIKEIERFKQVGSNSAESAVIRGYIETLLELPWDKRSKDNRNLKNASNILEADHYGLEKVKERVLEFLAVRNLTRKGDSPILCLVGPPGTGKTSIARSIASAMNKKYIRISLGGVRDEAEIRGHRRTYIGAMPGRLANGMKMAGVKNPLMLLDEIDKVSSDYKGDTSSALLEVLDSEQNIRFRDHYVEIPLDLSEVMFLATANNLQTIPKPLLDRMEIIEISSYTDNEKQHIAEEHLLAKQIRKHGLEKYDFEISKGAVKKIISAYTKEAGVRTLERKLGEICRKAAKEILESNEKSLKVTEKNLTTYLGKERYSTTRLNEEDEVGIVRGLAWTSVGGDTLQIEVNLMAGKGEIQLTGQLGEVMKESAQAGISYIRSVSDEYEIPEDFFKKHDIHIHIPEGAVPKDGPSAGITMATAMISAITKTPVKANVAMTGEITLRGRVLPIGGLKEKLLAAKNAGMKTVVVPKKNKLDVEEISMEIRSGLKIVFAEQMQEVLEVALTKEEN